MMDLTPISCRPPRFARKYGPSFQSFDNVDIASLCYREIGKVKVDCRFRLSKSQWGVLGDRRNPAGIIYMDLSFDQPKDCKLTSATVLVTLEEQEEEFFIPRNRKSVHVYSPPSFGPGSLQVTDHYGPKHLSGEPTFMPLKKTYNMTPELNMFGTGGGGVGVSREKQIIYTSRWTFTGQLQPGKEKRLFGYRGTAYRTLKWELTENDLDSQSLHSKTIHTGFAFEHDMKPFLLRVEIAGKLQKITDRLKEKVKRNFKFPPDLKEDQGTSLSLVLIDREDRFTRRLDSLAQSLPHEMELENFKALPVEIPDSLPAVFREAGMTTTDDSHESVPRTCSECGTSPKNLLAADNTSAVPTGRIDSPRRTLLDAPKTASNDPAEPTIESLSNALETFPGPWETRKRRMRVSSTPFAKHPAKKTQQSQRREGAVEHSPEEVEVVNQTISRFSQVPMFILLVQLLEGLLNLFAKKPIPARRSSLKGDTEHITRGMMIQEGPEDNGTIYGKWSRQGEALIPRKERI
ncbi:hypothetical protein VTN00DRAFT_3534 [Thermoascus crustaceus]|uniref:uncharacterized protein n=1 Tax=Thermoascus crustaceus TaxID=5088 RepID=UPI0037445BD3